MFTIPTNAVVSAGGDQVYSHGVAFGYGSGDSGALRQPAKDVEIKTTNGSLQSKSTRMNGSIPKPIYINIVLENGRSLSYLFPGVCAALLILSSTSVALPFVGPGPVGVHAGANTGGEGWSCAVTALPTRVSADASGSSDNGDTVEAEVSISFREVGSTSSYTDSESESTSGSASARVVHNSLVPADPDNGATATATVTIDGTVVCDEEAVWLPFA